MSFRTILTSITIWVMEVPKNFLYIQLYQAQLWFYDYSATRVPHAQVKSKTIPVDNEEVEKGSMKHQLGVSSLYYRIEGECYKSQPVLVSMKIGEVLCFCLEAVNVRAIVASVETGWSQDPRLQACFSSILKGAVTTNFFSLARPLLWDNSNTTSRLHCQPC